MTKNGDPREMELGENLRKEWDAEPQASDLLNALYIGETDPTAAMELMKEFAAKGSSLSMFYLGEYYMYGRYETERDFEAAEYWLNEAASRGSMEGAYLLARYFQGKGRYEEAEIEYRQLAERGFSNALFVLGLQHYKGDWLDKDIEKSIGYFEEAEKRGHLHARHWLSHIFRKENLGIGYQVKGWIKWITLVIPFVICKVNYPNSDRLRT